MDTSKGFVKFWRSMEDWEWYKDTNTFRVFFHLILKVNYKEKRWQGISVMPGQIITSAEGLAEDLHLSRQNVRTALEHLKSTGEITIKTTNKFSLITVANWASYQDNDTQPTSKSTSKITIDQPSTNHQLTTTKEVKKERIDIYMDIKDLWNSIVTSLPSLKGLPSSRKTHIQARIKDGCQIEDFKKVFALVQESDYLSGRNGKWMNCSFDWVCKPANWQKVVEGNYQNKLEQSKQLPVSGYDFSSEGH
jgi:hypothetical protein